MRIGSVLTSGVAINKFDKVQQRVIVQKHIPQAIQVFLYDLNYPNPTTLHVEGTLVGSTASDLATKMQQLKAVVRERKVIWIDASDAYQGRLDMVKIQKLQGPIVDSNSSSLTATFIIDAQILPPWGTTHTNPWRQNGIYFRDLNNVGREYAINPLMNHCNFTIDESTQPYTFSWEFIVDNQAPFTNATSAQQTDCDSLGSGTASATNPVAVDLGTTTIFGTKLTSLGIDNVNYKSGTGSLSATKTSPAASSFYGMAYDFGSSGIDISNYDRLRMWYRCDQTGLGSYYIAVMDVNGNYRFWQFTIQGANTWMNLEADVNKYNGDTGTPNLSAIRYIGGYVLTPSSSPPSSLTLWLDDIRLEVGFITHCEDTYNFGVQSGTLGSLSNDTAIFKNSFSGVGAASIPDGLSVETSTLSALKTNGTSNSSGYLSPNYTLPIGAWDWSSYDFLVFWWRSDFGGSSTGNLSVYIESTGGGFWTWAFNGLNASQWYRCVVPLKNPLTTSGSPSLSSIIVLSLGSIGAQSATTNVWWNEVSLDVGNVVNMEFNMPDNVSQTQQKNAIQVSSWSGSAYYVQGSIDVFGNDSGGAAYYLLDGTEASSVWASWWAASQVAPVGSTIIPAGVSFMGVNEFTLTYGCSTRFIFSLKLAPATSDVTSGNYPSNDLTGFQAINKARLKVLVYFTNDDTTYIGF